MLKFVTLTSVVDARKVDIVIDKIEAVMEAPGRIEIYCTGGDGPYNVKETRAEVFDKLDAEGVFE